MISRHDAGAWILVCLLAVCALLPAAAEGQSKGKFGSNTTFRAVAASNHRIIAAGTTDSCGPSKVSCPNADSDVVIARYRKSGALDKSFGRKGYVVVPQSEGLLQIDGLGVRDDDSVVVSVTNSGGSIGARLLSIKKSGKSDPSFGDNGVVSVPPTSFRAEEFTRNAMTLLPDGSAVIAGAAGTSGDPVFAVMRLDRAGEPVSSFGSGGIAEVEFGPEYEASGAGAVEVDRGGDSLLALGFVNRSSGFPTASPVAVSLDLADGAPTSGFGTDGSTVVLDGTPPTGLAIGIGRIAGGQIFLAPEGVGHSDCGGGFYLNSLQPDGASPGSLFGGSTAFIPRSLSCSDLTDVARVRSGLLAVGISFPGFPTRTAAVSASYRPRNGNLGRPSTQRIGPSHFQSSAHGIVAFGKKRAAVAGDLLAQNCRSPLRPGARCRVATLGLLKGDGRLDRRFGREGIATFPPAAASGSK